MSYHAYLPPDKVAQIDAEIARVRDTVEEPICGLKKSLQSGESPEHLFMRFQPMVHEDIHAAINREDVAGCQLLGQTIAHLMIRIAKLELKEDGRH